MRPQKAIQEARTVPVYANGTLRSSWHDASRGCMRCAFADASDVRWRRARRMQYY